MFSDHRQPLPEISNEELDSSLENISTYFTLDWLEDPMGMNPIQLLWKRPDFIATEELYILGKCIELHKSVNDEWLKYQVRLAKSQDLNTHRGAVFEIMGLGVFFNSDVKITPSAANQPGYDAILNYKNGPTINLSIKNYGVSKANETFLRNAEDFDQWLQTVLKKDKKSGLRYLIHKSGLPPEKHDWEVLKEIVEHQHKEGCPPENSHGWEIEVSPIEGYNIVQNLNYISYTLQITSQSDRNEYKNLHSKLEDACSNIAKHKKYENDKSINIILVHLPNKIDICSCLEWADWYFQTFKDKPVSGIVFYQPKVINTPTDLHIRHTLKVYFRKEHLKTIGIVNTPYLPFSIQSGQLDHEVVFSQEVDRLDNTFSAEKVGNNYGYKAGEIFITPDVVNGELCAEVSLEEGVSVIPIIGDYEFSLMGSGNLNLTIL